MAEDGAGGAGGARGAGGAGGGVERTGGWGNYFLTLLDRLPLPVAVCRSDGEVLIANPAMANQWGEAPGRLNGRNLLDLFRPRDRAQLERLGEALRRGYRSRYLVRVCWRMGGDGAEREGELSIDPVGDAAPNRPALLVLLRVGDECPARPEGAEVSPVEERVLALAASGATTAAMGKALGLTVDGVNYHLTRLSRRWRVPNRTALVARAYVLGVLTPGVWPPATRR
ncbi:helix-turn-helix transcriptional regulator [Streptomyces buecherae]|uniref:helix-turn-helix transcriptional regulator n=1 Tax=Streptomyces buecherae TaxID=2763006 RepID=UPI001C27869F|nr:PAS domain-containing protein [Streptomyces buecherae]